MIHYITTTGIGNAWVANELQQVRRAGIPFVLHTMRRPRSTYHDSPWACELDRQTRALYPLPLVELALSVLLAPLLFGRRFFAALANACFGRREHLRARTAAFVHLLVACLWARRLRREPVSHIHANWCHANGTVGMYGAWLLGVSFSFTGHATDLFRDRVALADKIRRARFIVCISEFHRRFWLEQGARSEQLHLVYCGIDPTHFRPAPRRPAATGCAILSTGRLVEKKGFADLLSACASLAGQRQRFTCTIAGNGPLLDSLRQHALHLGLADQITLPGQAIKQEDLPAFLHRGDLFVLPCVWAKDDDVDGLPQVLMEAMACGLPVISTRLVGIPDLVIHEQTGLLVEPGQPQQLAQAVQRLMDDPALAPRLAEAGRRHVLEHFDLDRCLEPLLTQFRACLAPAATPRPGAQGPAALAGGH